MIDAPTYYPKWSFQVMFAFFKKVNIHQGKICYSIWLILRVKGDKYWSEATTLPYKHILFVEKVK